MSRSNPEWLRRFSIVNKYEDYLNFRTILLKFMPLKSDRGLSAEELLH
ncbi:hypothetical protein NIES2104_42740 [Leptolyngbya sp. NIES-2104]|nr:hypothetical protein NIES2104_42740 [Leptolyngbya sp. NIES-2104]